MPNSSQYLQPQPFKKGYDPRRNTAGRPKGFVKSLKAQGYNKTEIDQTIQTMLSMSPEQLKELIQKPEITALEAMIGSAIQRATKMGEVGILETLLSRTFGKPKETVEVFHNTPELEAAKTLYESLIKQGLSKDEALQQVLQSAKNNGFELSPDDILNANTIG